MKKLVLVSVLGALLTGCGGGDGGSSDKDSSHNEQRPSAAQGTIERVSGNTVTVNGHQYDVASVSYSTVELSSSQLEPGMLIALSASKTRATGNHVQLEPTITGTITDINRNAGTFRVNGVPLTYSALSPEIENNNWVMVSSLPTANAGYKVLSVVKFDDVALSGIFEVEGTVSNLTSDQFKLGAGLTVSYTNDKVEDGPLANGVWVEVEGKTSGSTITATNIEVESYNDIDNDTEIEGLVTWVANDKSSFELNYRGRFNVTSQTRFQDGNKNHLVQGTMVEVTTGSSNTALEIEFDNDGNDSDDWNDNDIDIEGTVNAINSSNKSFTIGGSDLNKLDTVYVNQFTEFDDGLTFSTLTQQAIEVEAYIVNGQYIASEIERLD
ncbi:hypothetical protein EGH82_07220 [Vibrio ponticus]|uniref:DUF5666 domain-containing protein n=1 Tax=Vibrio ponticus TaxID=265668 RepID=A0A3N3E2Z5_9VIBR|nr:DUF5666 domain-containing protein [Vibrio ponticus]ROV60950.1 hypothetical protein EGH82_07220 [Vibrio ponticus]